ncbi:bZIP transcription factor [Cordyceps militaris CM01]|uniref:BZIP transcription factor n=1 Tax=Cordyceps militaris (strain CM01) TaxID=983644 RepID=G3JSC6_CORMM|nr:bZIP transcription factor [Cordyceps militaris CM01]EGX88825.1 bZIP transcription factor [Cordyceps militaris CM01]
MVRQSTQAPSAEAAGGDGDDGPHRRESRPLDESDAAQTPSSHQNEDTGSATAAKKRKLGAASSRGVANLTPEQLAKKRANDREAQRAIRERTKNQIQTLERRIAELTGLEPYQELQAALEAKAAVERENAEMRQRLAAVVGMLQPLISAEHQQQLQSTGTRGMAEPDSNHNRRTHSPPPPGQPTTTTVPTTTNGHVTQRLNDLDQQREQLRHGLDMGPERLGLGFLLDASHHVARIQAAAAADTLPATYRYPNVYTQQQHHQQQQQQQQAPSVAGSGSASPGPSTVSSSAPQWQPNTTYTSAFFSGYPAYADNTTSAAGDDGDDEDAASNADEAMDTGSGPPTILRYACPVRTTPPTCPLDALLLDFLHERRQRAAEGLPTHEVLGPRYPSVSSLLNPAHSACAHPLSRVFTDILAKFPAISGLPERVAVLYLMFLLMRWQVSPTRGNYERLPRWARPLRAQLRAPPHPAWIDHLPFPRMRAVLVRDHASGLYPFDDFSVAYTTTLTLSWPYHDTDTLLQSPHSEELMINPVFERHLRNLDNWKLGAAFAKAFPGLADTGNVPEAELAKVRAAATSSVADGGVGGVAGGV